MFVVPTVRWPALSCPGMVSPRPSTSRGWLALAALVLAVGFSAASFAAPAGAAVLARTTFDDPALGADGWYAQEITPSVGALNSMQYHYTQGNPGGYMQASDLNDGRDWYWIAPAKFLGNKSIAYGGTFTVDLRQRLDPGESPNQDWEDDDVILVGGGLTLVYQVGSKPPIGPAHPDSTGSWATDTVPLTVDDPNWHVGDYTGAAATPEQLQTVLADLTFLAVRGEYQAGMDYGDVDNPTLNAPLGAGPGGFNLVAPANGANVLIPDQRFLWNTSHSTAPGDSILYTVLWSESADFSASDSVSAGADTSYAFPPHILALHHTYYWKVRATDRWGLTIESDPIGGWSFYVEADTPAGLAVVAQASAQDIELRWNVPADMNVRAFRVYRRAPDSDWARLGADLPGQGPAVLFTDNQALPGIRYQYEVEVEGPAGPQGRFGPVSAEISGTEVLSLAVGPNPGRGSAVLRFSLPWSGPVTFRLFDLGGRERARQSFPDLAAGAHLQPWTPGDGGLGAGTYWVRMDTPTGAKTARWVIVR